MTGETTEIHYGFTGTRRGASREQLERVEQFLAQRRSWWHHGDCVGADEQVHGLAREHGWKIAIHPPIIARFRAYCQGDLTHQPMEYLQRDRGIINACAKLIATPRTYKREPRSGTWTTIRYAREQGKPVMIIYPDGSVSIVTGNVGTDG